MKKILVMCLASFLTLLSFGQNEVSENQLKSMMSSMMGDVKVEESYSFSKSIVYETYEINSSGKNKKVNKIEMLFSEGGESFGIKMLEEKGKPVKKMVTILLDISADVMITLMEDKPGEKSGVAIKIPKKGLKLPGMNSEKDEDVTLTKTSETRLIKGYTCTKYIGNSKDASSVSWVADDLDMSFAAVFHDLFKSKSPSFDKMPEGAMLEAISTDKDGNKTVMEAVEVNTNTTLTLSTKEYNVMSMGQMMKGTE
tara:strand:- start:3397 stop:4158 length:762 start_codon:yes stop_codon:yes gene_type:complete